jgi:probable rRNA maturation factor
MLAIDLVNQQGHVKINRRRLTAAVRAVLREAGVRDARVSVAVVDDPAIHALNRRFLGHDYPTDVLSFPLERSDGRLEGEIVVSAETAVAQAARFGWPAAHELLLYVVHGALHLVGYEDATPRQRTAMRDGERAHLGRMGLTVPRKKENRAP